MQLVDNVIYLTKILTFYLNKEAYQQMKEDKKNVYLQGSLGKGEP